MSLEDSTAVTLARIEGKLDLLRADITAAENRGADHEARLRALESQSAVTWRQVVAVVGAFSAAVAAATPFLAQLYGGS